MIEQNNYDDSHNISQDQARSALGNYTNYIKSPMTNQHIDTNRSGVVTAGTAAGVRMGSNLNTGIMNRRLGTAGVMTQGRNHLKQQV